MQNLKIFQLMEYLSWIHTMVRCGTGVCDARASRLKGRSGAGLTNDGIVGHARVFLSYHCQPTLDAQLPSSFSDFFCLWPCYLDLNVFAVCLGAPAPPDSKKPFAQPFLSLSWTVTFNFLSSWTLFAHGLILRVSSVMSLLEPTRVMS
jgi:hypothetical protein